MMAVSATREWYNHFKLEAFELVKESNNLEDDLSKIIGNGASIKSWIPASKRLPSNNGSNDTNCNLNVVVMNRGC